MKKNTYFIFTLLLILLASNNYLSSQQEIKTKEIDEIITDEVEIEQIRIAAIFPNDKEKIWTDDANILENISLEMGTKYLSYYANNTIDSQMKLVDKALRDKIDILILPIAATTDSSKIIERAYTNGIKVVTYLNPPDMVDGVDMHIAFDYKQAGYNQILYSFNQNNSGAYLFIMGIPTDYKLLNAYRGSIDAFKFIRTISKIKIVARPYQIDWDDEAIKNYIKLSITNNPDISTIIIPDDSMSLPAVKAIRELNLARSIQISGQNLTPLSASYILNGIQFMSTYAHQNALALEAFKIAYEIATKGNINPNDNNNPIIVRGKALPTYYICPQIIDKYNFKEAILDKGYITEKAIARSKIYQ